MTSTARAVTGGLLGVWLLGHPVRAGQFAAQAPVPPTFRGGNNFVRVDVVATGKDGSPVTDLNADDFEITESGKHQKVETFKRIVVDGGSNRDGDRAISSDAAEEEDAARDDVRMFAIFLDDYHVSPASGEVVRDQLARLVETGLGPDDLVGTMMPLAPLAAVRMSRDRAAVATAIRKFEGRRGNYAPKNVFEENYVGRTSNAAAIRRDVSFSAIRGLIMRMGGLKEGRKALLVVSEGYGAGSDVNRELRDIGDLASRNNTAIYPVTPRLYGPATGWMPVDLADGLNILAERSGGRLIVEHAGNLAELRDRRTTIGTPRSRLALAMKQIVVDASAYYLLGYNSARPAPDGRFHKIDVAVHRPGIQLRYRQGYFSWRPEDLAATANPSAFTAKPLSVVETTLAGLEALRGRPIRTWIGMARGARGLTKVTVVWEPLPRVPGEERPDRERPARVALKATGADSLTYFEGGLPERIVVPSTGGVAVFEVPAGSLQLRLAVENAGGTTIDTDVRTVKIEDLSTTRTALGTPMVFRARTVPEWQRLQSAAEPKPAAAREFSRTERLLIRVPLYRSTTKRVNVSASLLNRAAQHIAELPITAAELDVLAIDVALASLAPGDYAVRIATDGDDPLSEIVAFRVTN